VRSLTRQRPDHLPLHDDVARHDARRHRLVGCPDAIGVIDRDHRPIDDHSRERDDAVGSRQHRSPRARGDVHAAVPRTPGLIRVVEERDHLTGERQRVTSAAVVGQGARRDGLDVPAARGLGVDGHPRGRERERARHGDPG